MRGTEAFLKCGIEAPSILSRFLERASQSTTIYSRYPCFLEVSTWSRCMHSSHRLVQSCQQRNLTLSSTVLFPQGRSQKKMLLLNGALSRNIKTQSKQGASKKGAGQISFGKRAVVVATIGGLLGYSYWSVNRQKQIDVEKVRYEEFKKAQLGGDWVLTDQNGKKRSSTEFRGQWILMYFGFTHCPDICPEELEKLIRIVKTFDADPRVPNMLPIFITLDPERDTPTAIRDYLADLKYPRMMGFTGSEEEIAQVAKKFRAYYKKGPPDEDNDYIVDHTIVIYLINPKGEFVNYYDRSRTAERITKSAKEHISKYLSLEKNS